MSAKCGGHRGSFRDKKVLPSWLCGPYRLTPIKGRNAQGSSFQEEMKQYLGRMEKWPLKDVHNLISGSLRYATLHVNRELRLQVALRLLIN